VGTEEEIAAGSAAPGDWPDDPAGPGTPVAHSAADVARLAGGAATLSELSARQSVCRACPRLVAWREQVAVTRRRAFRGERYWGRPLPGWGAEHPRLLIVGLAPAAHGGNRTGRIFTGDRSGDVLFASLYRCGFAVQPISVAADDGQRLMDARMAAAVRCAPPANKPEPTERGACAAWLVAELRLVAADLRVIVCLGGFAWQAIWPAMNRVGFAPPRPRPAFGHGTEVRLTSPHAPDGVLVIGCYHPSQQNTFTGRVTPAMLDAVFTRARAAADLEAPTAPSHDVTHSPARVKNNPRQRNTPDTSAKRAHPDLPLAWFGFGQRQKRLLNAKSIM
jgi:uracil-DNA glycosylase